jgi:hypothetical protein
MIQGYCITVQYGSPLESAGGGLAYFLPRLLGRLRRLPLYVGLFGPRPLLPSCCPLTCGSGGVFSIRRSTSSGEGAGRCFMALEFGLG